MRFLTALAVGALPFAGGSAAGQTPDTAGRLVTTRHQMTLAGRTVRYAATAGFLPIVDNEAGEPHARMFFVAYTVDRARGRPPRPVTFLWNGGPGSSSSQVHLLGFGPRRIRTVGVFPTNPVLSDTVVDNQETWLDFTDLVFVDPVLTGYSRPTKPEYAAEFLNTRGDIESIAEFIRVYRIRFDAWKAPLFLAGESYGVARAQGVAEALERRRTRVAGLMLISGGLTAGQTVPQPVSTALAVPRLTAIAHYHRKLPADLQSNLSEALKAAETWARTEYAPALARRDSLTPAARSSVVDQLIRFTGADPRLVDPRTLAIPGTAFSDRLLLDRGIELGRYDARLTGSRNVATTEWDPKTDPSLLPVIDLMLGTSEPLVLYIRNVLSFRTDLLYQGPFGEGYHYPHPTTDRGDWMSTRWNGGALVARDTTARGAASSSGRPTAATADTTRPAPPPPPPLRRAMQINPKLRVLVMTGVYDMVVPSCIMIDESIARLDEPVRSRIAGRCYDGGHMMYTDTKARREMRRDAGAFVTSVTTADTARREPQ